MMIRLPRSLAAWGTPFFAETLKQELEEQPPGQLPLQHCLSSSSVALDDPPQVMVISFTATPGIIRARVGVFFGGIIAGCSCTDDPTPVQRQEEYGELLVAIDQASATASITLAEE